MTLETIERLKQIHNYNSTGSKPESNKIMNDRNSREVHNTSNPHEKLTFGMQQNSYENLHREQPSHNYNLVLH